MNEPTHFADGREIPQTFCFMFEDGPKWEKDMTREELLHVINYLLAEKKWLARELKTPKWWQRATSGEGK